MSNDQHFETWAIVEVKGFTTYAGLVTEATIAGHGFLRVDVPAASPGKPAFTKYISPTAVHCITPTDEESVKLMVLRLSAEAIPASIARLVGPGGYDGERW
jgi:hypothetical protein